MARVQKKTLEYLPNVVDALKNDVPKSDYRRLQKGTIQRASAELGAILAKIQGANKDNVKCLRKCLTHANKREFEALHDEVMLEEAFVEYEVLRQTFYMYFGEKERIVEAIKGQEYRYPIPGKWERIKQQPGADIGGEPLPVKLPPRNTRHLRDDAGTTTATTTKERESISTFRQEEPLTARTIPLTTRQEKYDAFFLRNKNDAPSYLQPEGLAFMSPVLEDPVRKQIAIQFRQLYDHYRAAAFDDLVTIGALWDDEAVKLLTEMLKGAIDFCKKVATRQLDHMLESIETCIVSPPGQIKREGVKRQMTDIELPPYMMKDALKLCKQFRKQACRVSITKIKKEFYMQPIVSLLPIRTENIINYLHKCAEVTWLMVMQEPQMTFYWPEVGEIRPDMFKFYSGNAVFDEFCVWPALLHCHNGPVCDKGYVQPMAPDLPMPSRKAPPTASSNMDDIGYGTPLPPSSLSEESLNIM